MEIYTYLIETLKFEVNVKTELTADISSKICNEINISSKNLISLLKKNILLFEYKKPNLTLLIQEVCPEDDDYMYQIFCGYKVLIKKDIMFINATRYCRNNEFSFQKWFDNNQNLLDYIDLQLKIDSVVKNVHENKILKGMYVHPQLMVHIISWIHPEFALQISKKMIIPTMSSPKSSKIIIPDKTLDWLFFQDDEITFTVLSCKSRLKQVTLNKHEDKNLFFEITLIKEINFYKTLKDSYGDAMSKKIKTKQFIFKAKQIKLNTIDSEEFKNILQAHYNKYDELNEN